MCAVQSYEDNQQEENQGTKHNFNQAEPKPLWFKCNEYPVHEIQQYNKTDPSIGSQMSPMQPAHKYRKWCCLY